jgi:hypothetical protein
MSRFGQWLVANDAVRRVFSQALTRSPGRTAKGHQYTVRIMLLVAVKQGGKTVFINYKISMDRHN